jgi:hypothetical protein
VNFEALIATVVTLLNRAGIPYMLTGSLASSYHGEPRATRDLDMVIDPAPAALDQLIASILEAGLYVDPSAAHEALAIRTQFNAIDRTGTKVDFIIRRDRPFSIEEFRRRRPADLLGTAGFLATAEDMIIAKLEWAAATDSQRQRRDVAGMLAVGGDAIDHRYIARWVEALGLQVVWAEVVAGD